MVGYSESYLATGTMLTLRFTTAVSIDERRAKFRQDLLLGSKTSKHHLHHRHRHAIRPAATDRRLHSRTEEAPNPGKREPDRFRRPSQVRNHREGMSRSQSPSVGVQDARGHLIPGMQSIGRARSRDRPPSRSMSPVGSVDDASSIHSGTTQNSLMAPMAPPDDDSNDEDEAAAQDIEEVWFPGCHADLGGGWPLSMDEESPLSHGPLVW